MAVYQPEYLVVIVAVGIVRCHAWLSCVLGLDALDDPLDPVTADSRGRYMPYFCMVHMFRMMKPFMENCVRSIMNVLVTCRSLILYRSR